MIFVISTAAPGHFQGGRLPQRTCSTRCAYCQPIVPHGLARRCSHQAPPQKPLDEWAAITMFQDKSYQLEEAKKTAKKASARACQLTF